MRRSAELDLEQLRIEREFGGDAEARTALRGVWSSLVLSFSIINKLRGHLRPFVTAAATAAAAEAESLFHHLTFDIFFTADQASSIISEI